MARNAAKTIETRAKDIIAEQLGVDEEEIKPAAKFIDDLGADSLDHVELIMGFEQEFDIEIPDEDAEKIMTFGDAIAYLTKRGIVDKASGVGV